VEFALAFQKFAQKKTLAMPVVPFQVGLLLNYFKMCILKEISTEGKIQNLVET
jgi:hypothetical protein